MFQKKDWKMTFAMVLLFVLLGGYYEKLGVEARTMVLPLAIFIAAGIIIARLKRIEYEINTFKVNAKEVIVQRLPIPHKCVFLISRTFPVQFLMY
jgi:hypothetical protein